MRSKFAGIGVAAAVVLVGAVGCGAASEKLAEKATEKALESSAGGNIDVDLKGDGGMTIKGEDGEEIRFDVDGESMTFTGPDGESSFQAGGGAQLPDDWPAELAVPSGAVTAAVNQTSDGTRSSYVTASSDLSVDEVVSGFKDRLSSAGYDINGESNMTSEGTEMAGFQATKGDTQVSISAASSPGEKTTLTISLEQPV